MVKNNTKTPIISTTDNGDTITISGKMVAYVISIIMAIGSLTTVYTTLKTDLVTLYEITHNHTELINEEQNTNKEQNPTKVE